MEERKDFRVAFIGNVDSGKSSLIGTLMQGDLDDGRGSARRFVFRHKHEVESGRTSSIATTYVGFHADGHQVFSKRHGKAISIAELAQSSTTCIQLIDLAGHERYLKTTVFGLTGMQPHFAIVVVGANMGVKKMTKEHLGIAIALDIPIVIALTKIDIAPKNIAKETVQTIRAYLRKHGKMPMLVKTLEQATAAADGLPSNRITPIFPLSNVTGDGLDNLRHLLRVICQQPFEKSQLSISNNLMMDTYPDFEFSIDDTYQIPGVGFVVGGAIIRGRIAVNDTLYIGPDHNGHFHSVTVRSIESMHVPLREAQYGQHASFAIRALNKKTPINRTNFRKGMVLVDSLSKIHQIVSHYFEARVLILHHQTTIGIGYEPVINCRTIRQTAQIIKVAGTEESPKLRTGDRALVRFRFLTYAEYIPIGARFVFRDGQAKGIGKIIRVLSKEEAVET